MPRQKNIELHLARRAQILASAKRCFVADGFHQTTMRQIIESAGLSAGGAYNYFASKAEIVKGIVEEERSGISELERHLVAAEDPLLGLGELVSDIIAYTDHESAVLATEIYAEACRNAEIRALTQANTAELMRIVLVAIKRGRKSGLISSEYRIAELAEFVIGLIEGCIGRIASDPAIKPSSIARVAKKIGLQVLGATRS